MGECSMNKENEMDENVKALFEGFMESMREDRETGAHVIVSAEVGGVTYRVNEAEVEKIIDYEDGKQLIITFKDGTVSIYSGMPFKSLAVPLETYRNLYK